MWPESPPATSAEPGSVLGGVVSVTGAVSVQAGELGLEPLSAVHMRKSQ